VRDSLIAIALESDMNETGPATPSPTQMDVDATHDPVASGAAPLPAGSASAGARAAGRARPASAWLLIALMAFQAASALAGGAAMLIAPRGGIFPIEMLAASPFDTFLIPGLLLFGVLGVLPAVATWALLARPRWRAMAPVERAFAAHWSWPFAGALGVALVIFIAVEVAMIGGHWLQGLYGGVGLALVALTLWPDTRRSYRR
jgi:hypothetical protein